MIRPGQWYELRVEGSAGTKSGIVNRATEGIAIGENGRLISIKAVSIRPMRFETEQQALDYLVNVKLSGEYDFEAVLCGYAVDKGED